MTARPHPTPIDLLSTQEHTVNDTPTGAATVTLNGATLHVGADAPTRPVPLPASSTPPPSEPSAPAAEPSEPSRPSGRAKKWWARLVVVAMLAGAGYGGYQLIGLRTEQQNRISLGNMILTAQATPVAPEQAGVVTEVDVQPQQYVTRGWKLGTYAYRTADSDGDQVTRQADIVAPSDGVIADQPKTVGSNIDTGTPFVAMYDPAQMTFVGNVSIDVLSRLQAGAAVTLEAGDGVTPVDASITRVVPRVDGAGAQAPAGYLEVVLTPANPQQVANLIPGYVLVATTVADPATLPSQSVLSGL